MLELSCAGLSRETAALEVRERAALDARAARSLLRALRASGAALQSLVLSPCNRTEVYAVVRSEPAVLAPGAIRAMLASRTRITSDELERHGYVRWEHDAAEHLFAVTAGLQSTVLGETEIVAQTRAAVALAVHEGRSVLFSTAWCSMRLLPGAGFAPQPRSPAARRQSRPLRSRSPTMCSTASPDAARS